MRNITLLTDLYQLTMMQTYFENGEPNKLAGFDMFFRAKEKIHYCVFAGLQQVVEYITNIKFNDDDIEYLRQTGNFSQAFLDYLKDFSFHGDIYSVKEGEFVFPNEPIVTVVASLCEAQFIETTLLNIINHQTLIATKASRVKYAAGDRAVMEFGLRRAQGPDAGLYGSRASIIGGCESTSNVLAAKEFDLIPSGTHAHSLVQSFDTELEAFRYYAKSYPDKCLLLLDTYNVLKSGLENAIIVFKELEKQGKKPLGIRIDSGDFAYLSKKIRARLDEEGFDYCKICVSGDLDEYSIASLETQGAKIDSFGVGTKLITSEDMPSLGGVYKMCSIESKNGFQVYDGRKMAPKMKLSENSFKITNPALKKIVRIYDENDMAQADLLTLFDEEIDESKPLTIFAPEERWKKTIFKNFHTKNIVQCVIKGGKLVQPLPTTKEIVDYAKKTKESFWQEYKRLDAPHIYKVDLSEKLLDIKQNLIDNIINNM